MLGLKLDSLAKNISRTKNWYARQMIEDNIDDYELACLALQAKEDKLFCVEDSLSLGKLLLVILKAFIDGESEILLMTEY